MTPIQTAGERAATLIGPRAGGSPGHGQVPRPSMLTRYMKAALQHATYQPSADGQSYRGEIPGLPGLYAQAATRDACRLELRDMLETWRLLRLCQQLPIPPIDGIPLAAWVWMQRGV